MLENPQLQLLQFRRRIQSQIVGELVTEHLVAGQSVCLTPRCIQGSHVQGPDPLPLRILRHPAIKLADIAATSINLDPDCGLNGPQLQLGQPGNLRTQHLMSIHALERLTVPKLERVSNGGGGLHRLGVELLVSDTYTINKVDRIYLTPIETSHITAAISNDHLPQKPAEIGNISRDRSQSPVGHVITPDRLDQPVDRHRLTRIDGQHRQNRPLLRATQRQPDPISHRFNRPQQLDTQHPANLPARNCKCPSRRCNWSKPFGGRAVLTHSRERTGLLDNPLTAVADGFATTRRSQIRRSRTRGRRTTDRRRQRAHSL